MKPVPSAATDPADPAEAAAPLPPTDASLGARLDLLYRGAPLSAVVGLIEAAVLSTLFWRHVPLPALLGWLAVFAAIRLGRVALSRSYFRDRARGGDPQRWVRAMQASALAQALAWGVGSWVLMAPQDLIAESALHVALVALTLGGVNHLANFYPLVKIYAFGVFVPVLLRDLWIGGLFHTVLGLSCSLTILYMVSNGRRQAEMITEAIAQRHRNLALIDALQRENAVTREAQHRMQVAQRRAEQAHEARARFFAAANHDLRQPLHAIGLLAQTLRHRGAQADVPQIAGQISDCVDSLSLLVDELLELSRLDIGARAPVRAPLRLAPLVREVMAAHEPMARAKGLALTVDLGRASDGRPADPSVLTDASLLARVLSNLVGNAIRYTPAGEVRLVARLVAPPGGRVEPPRGALEIAVEDTGVGIPADELPRIFDEFYQVGQPGRGERQGLGLGLATVRRIDVLLGLNLQVRSVPGQGSTFSFTLPVAFGAPPLPPPVVEGPLDPLDGCRVLVLEDDPAAADALATLLVSWGCEVRAVADTAEALKCLDEGFRPEAMVADLRLGRGEDGVEAIARVQAALGASGASSAAADAPAPRLPALLVTGDAVTPRPQALMAAGGVVLRKPVKPSRLRAWLQGVARTAPVAPRASR
jgi:two-component system, sensor histidine kinase